MTPNPNNTITSLIAPVTDQPKELHIKVYPDGSLRVGTCSHCVLGEDGRPERAWNNKGDSELDFPRDRLVEYLAQLGITAQIQEEFVCP